MIRRTLNSVRVLLSFVTVGDRVLVHQRVLYLALVQRLRWGSSACSGSGAGSNGRISDVSYLAATPAITTNPQQILLLALLLLIYSISLSDSSFQPKLTPT